jgi:hypothetical protein
MQPRYMDASLPQGLVRSAGQYREKHSSAVALRNCKFPCLAIKIVLNL